MNTEIREYIQPGKKNIFLIYLLYLFGTAIAILPLIGVTFAYAYAKVENPLWRSHYQFAFRTFIIGGAAIIGSSIFSFAFLMNVGLFFIGFLLYIVIFVWCLVRSIIALGYLMNNAPHPAPYSLWIK